MESKTEIFHCDNFSCIDDYHNGWQHFRRMVRIVDCRIVDVVILVPQFFRP
jgi:hypothetical protein